METIITPLQQELISAAVAMAAKKEIDHLLYVGDLPLPDELVKARSTARKKEVQAVSSEAQRQVIEAMGIPTIAPNLCSKLQIASRRSCNHLKLLELGYIDSSSILQFISPILQRR